MEPLFPDLTADWKVTRNCADAIAEAVGQAVGVLLDELEVPPTEEQTEELFDRVYALATTGELPDKDCAPH